MPPLLTVRAGVQLAYASAINDQSTI